MNAEVTVAQKPNQGTNPKGGCNPFRGSFFASPERSRRIGQAKKKTENQQAVSIKNNQRTAPAGSKKKKKISEG